MIDIKHRYELTGAERFGQCSCCEEVSDVFHINFHNNDSTHTSTVILCKKCLCKLQIAITEKIDEEKLPLRIGDVVWVINKDSNVPKKGIVKYINYVNGELKLFDIVFSNRSRVSFKGGFGKSIFLDYNIALKNIKENFDGN